jgi:hypothetical protein
VLDVAVSVLSMTTSREGSPPMSVAVVSADQRPSLSRTFRVIVWVPGFSVEVEKEAAVPMVPSMEEVHS